MSSEVDWAAVAYFQEQEYEEQSEEAFFESMRVKIKEIVEENSPRQVNAICPMQLMSQMNETLSKESDFFGKIINIKGIFKPGNGVLYANYYYDNLKDENTNTQIKFLVPSSIRNRMKPDSLVIARGMVCKRIDALKSSVDLQFRVDSLVEEVKEQAIDKDEVKRIEYRQRKVAAGFKNVDSILENMLMKDERPRVALLLPTTNRVFEDFEHGKRAASVAIDFVDRTVTFTHTSDLCNVLRTLDGLGFDAIALVRGGGIDPKTDVDKPEVIETVVGMKTPFISGLGHAPEIIFLRQVADKWTPNPNALGQYFAEMVEKVAETRNGSRAVLEAQVKKQYEDLLKAEQKMNADLKKQNEDMKTLHANAEKQLTEANKVKLDALQSQLKTEQLLVSQLQDKLNAQGNRIWVYVIIALIALIAGFVIARMFPPIIYY